MSTSGRGRVHAAVKLLSTYSSVSDAEDRSRFLESKGIAAFVSSKHSMRLGRYFTGAFRVGLWVILDEQYDDAIRVLNDSHHEVSYKLPQSEIAAIRQSINTGDKSVVLRLLFQILLIAVGFAVAVLTLTQLWR